MEYNLFLKKIDKISLNDLREYLQYSFVLCKFQKFGNWEFGKLIN